MLKNVAETMESDIVNNLKRERGLMVKLKAVVVFRSRLELHHVTSYAWF